MHEIPPFSLPEFRNFIPEKIRPWIIIAFVIVFQLSGGVYLAALGEMSGSLALMREDILMAGYASLAGLALTFAIMFRLKFRFPLKQTFIICSSAIIIGNIIVVNTSSVPLMFGVCFITGIFRMWGTFGCNSAIQLWLTPKRDLSVFFCYIELLVQGMIEIGGITTIYTAFFAKWEYMYLLVIGLFLIVIITTIIIFRTIRTLPKLPLFGIDWVGILLWCTVALSLVFIMVYGDFYDWFNSPVIWTALITTIVTLVLNLWRSSFIRHPFYELKTWRFKPLYYSLIIYLVISTLNAPSRVLEEMYMGVILHYDTLNIASMKLWALAGIAIGAFFSWRTFAIRKWRYKTMTTIGFSFLVLYLILFYFVVDFNLPKEALILPILARSIGFVILSITLLTALSLIPFTNFFQAVSIQGFFSAAIASAFGEAIVGRLFKVLVCKNSMLLGSEIDNVNVLAKNFSLGELYGIVQIQAIAVSMKEIFGWLILVGLGTLMIYLLRESSLRPTFAIHPKYRTIRRYIKHQLRMDKADE